MKDNIKSKIKIDKENVVPIASVKQGDDLNLEINLVKDNKPFTPTGQTVRVGARLPNNAIQEQSGGITVSGDKLTIQLMSSIISMAGIVEIDVEFKDSDGVTTSSSFYIEVIEKTLNNTAVEATDYIDSLETLIVNFTEDYESLKRIIIDENVSVTLQEQITTNKNDIASANAKITKNTTDIATVSEEMAGLKRGGIDTILSTSAINGEASKRMVFDLSFVTNDTRNQQGLTFHDGYYYIGVDIDGVNSTIMKFASTGKKVGELSPLQLGHCAGLAYRTKDMLLYVANGGGNQPTKVKSVDYDANRIFKEYDFSNLGNAGLVAIDNIKDEMILHTSSSDSGKHKFSFVGFDGIVRDSFEMDNMGVPQGLEVNETTLYFYTNNKITMIDLTRKIIINSIDVPKIGESEGICLVKKYGTTSLAVGYNNPNRIYILGSPSTEEFSNIKMIGSANQKGLDNIDLLPRRIYFGVRKLNGRFTYLNWGNHINTENYAKVIAWNAQHNQLEIAFNSNIIFNSVMYLSCDTNAVGYSSDIRLFGEPDAGGNIVKLHFFKNGAKVQLEQIPEGIVGWGYLDCGLRIDY